MKAFFSFFVCLSLSGFALAQNFEGIITMTSDGDENVKIVFSMKGNNVLMEMNAEQGQPPIKTLTEKDSRNMITFVEKDGQQYAIKMGPEVMQMAGQEAMGNQKMKTPDFDINITKETKIINGYNCFKVIGKDDTKEVTAWLTKDLRLTLFDMVPILKEMSAVDTESALQNKIMEEGLLLEGTSKDLETGEVTTIQVDVKKQPLDDALFNYQSDNIKIFDMTNMMSLMGEMQNDPEKMKEFEELMKLLGN